MNQQLNSIIIDDEVMAANNLELTLQKYCPFINNLGKAHSLSDGINLIHSSTPQLVFLDVSLASDETGFDLLDLIPNRNFQTIFVTAHPDYSLKAIKKRAFDYILKPIDYRELIKSTQELINTHFRSSVKTKKSGLIPIPSIDGTHLIKPENILFCKANGSYSNFYLENGKKITLSKSLKHAEELLTRQGFMRIHRSYIINSNKVSKIHSQDGGYLEIGKEVLPISKSYLENVLKLYS